MYRPSTRLAAPILALVVVASVAAAPSALGTVLSARVASGRGAAATGTPVAAATVTPAAVSCAQAALARLTQAQRVGQLFLFGVPGTTLDATTSAAISSNHFGSVWLVNNRTGGVAAVRNLTGAIQALAPSATAGVQFFVAADQEGGYVQRLSGPGFSTIPTALYQGTLATSTLQADATVWGRQLAAAGVNLNFAPVMDVVPPGFDASNPPIGQLQREYGHDPTTVGTHGAAVLAGMHAAGVATTIKHFPGLGRVTGNTDYSSGVTDTVTTSTDPYLGSFRSGIAAGADFVMMSLATYAKIDPSHVAALSPAIVTNLLRGQLGFGGVIVSDSLGAAAVSAIDPATRAVSFINAGGDVILIQGASVAGTMAAALRNRAATDATFRAKVDAAALRVLQAKAARGLLMCGQTAYAVNLRSGPSTSYGIVATLAAGTRFDVRARIVQDASGRTWAPIVSSSGAPGFIASAYASFSGSAVTTGGLNLRRSPSTAASIVAVLPAGAFVSITGSTADSLARTWLAVRTSLGSGWVASWYTTP